MKQNFTLQSFSTRAVLMLLTMLSTTVTTWADGITLQTDNDFAAGTAGHYYINMPAGSNKEYTYNTFNIPTTWGEGNNALKSFKLYDDGGKNNTYTYHYYGSWLTLKAPSGCILRLRGSMRIFSNSNKAKDYLTIKDGGTSSSTYCKWGGYDFVDQAGSRDGIDVRSSGEEMTLYFMTSGNSTQYQKGFDFTIDVIQKTTPYTVTRQSATRGSVSCDATAAYESDVAVTFLPNSYYEGTTSTYSYKANDNVTIQQTFTVADNSGTFKMPGSDVTITPAFKPIDYTITYTDAVNGQSDVANSNPVTYNVESAAITLTAPTRFGYTFEGWTGEGISTPTKTGITIPAHSHGNKTFVAHWTAINDPTNVTLTEGASDVALTDGQTLSGTGGGNTHVTIAAGATVTLDNTTINSIYCKNWAGITCLGDATIILKNGTTNTITGGYDYYPGIYIPQNSTLTIQGTGKLVATGKYGSPGIGGQKNSKCGNIVIMGGDIEATGSGLAPGIGGSAGQSCGDITITSGVTKVKATKGNNNSQPYSIGSSGNNQCGTVTIGGVETGRIAFNPYIYEPSVTYTIQFNNNGGTGEMTDQTIQSGFSQNLKSNTLTRNDYLFEGWATNPDGSGDFYSDGQELFNPGDLTLYAIWTPYNYVLTSETGAVKLHDGQTLSGTGGANTRITIDDGATVSLNNVNITGITYDNNHMWPGISCEGDATIILLGDNSVKGGKNGAGIFVPENKTLTIQGTGSLTATGLWSAGIGSSNPGRSGQIIISGGIINAISDALTAGIGGGKNTVYDKKNTGGIIITGDVISVTATSGENYSDSPITSNEGTVTIDGSTTWTAGTATENLNFDVLDGGRTWKLTHRYAITYDLAGGAVETENPTTYTVESADITLNNPTRDGYTFTGWTYEGQTAPTLNVTIAQGATGNRSYTANWKKNATNDELIYTIPSEVTYTGSAITPEVIVMDGENDVTSHFDISYDDNVNVGTATITFTAKAESNDYVGEAVKTFTISKKPLTITAEAKTKVYGEADPELTYTVDGLIEGDALTGALTRAEGEDVGEYDITQGSLAANDYYDITFTGAKLTITALTISGVSATAYSGTYDGAPHRISVTIPDGMAIKYGTAEGTYDKDAAPSYTSAGEYTTYYQVTKANHNAVTGSAKVTITQKALTITADAKTKVFGAADPALTYTTSGLLEGETLTGALTRAEGENVGEYDITQGSLTAGGNYSVTFTGAKFTITAATLSGVSATGYEGTFDGQAHTIKVTAPEGATVKYGESADACTQDAAPEYTKDGEYTIYYQVSKDNYNTVTGSAMVIITPSTVIDESQSETIDGETFYEPNEETKEAMHDHFDTDMEMTADAANHMNMNGNHEMEFSAANDVDVVIKGELKGDIITINFTGHVYVHAGVLRQKNVAATRSTRSDDDMELVSGVEYEVQGDGDIVLILAVHEGDVTLKGITNTHANSNTTGIEGVKSEEVNSEKWYDMNGRPLQSKPTKRGLYIHNGKKVVIK